MATTSQWWGDIAQGVGAGAGAGSAFGPIGSGIGALVGGIGGAIEANNTPDMPEYKPPTEDPHVAMLRKQIMDTLTLPPEQRLRQFQSIYDSTVAAGKLPLAQLSNTYAARRMTGSTGYLGDASAAMANVELNARKNQYGEMDASNQQLSSQLDSINKNGIGLGTLYNQSYATQFDGQNKINQQGLSSLQAGGTALATGLKDAFKTPAAVDPTRNPNSIPNQGTGQLPYNAARTGAPANQNTLQAAGMPAGMAGSFNPAPVKPKFPNTLQKNPTTGM